MLAWLAIAAVLCWTSGARGATDGSLLDQVASRIAALEREAVSETALLSELSAANARVAELEAEVAELSGLLHSLSGSQTQCGCNAFNGSVTISAGAGEPVDLTVGTPETGFVNGVNINQLDAEAVRSSGPQNIAGALTVESLNIGDWSLTTDGAGNLVVAPQSGTGSVVVLTDVTVDGQVTANEGVNAYGSSSFSDVFASGSVEASSLIVQSSYSLCNGSSSSSSCITQYPTFMNIAGAPIVDNALTCPEGWTIVTAAIDCDMGNFVINFLLDFPPGATSAQLPTSGCNVLGSIGFLACMTAGSP